MRLKKVFKYIDNKTNWTDNTNTKIIQKIARNYCKNLNCYLNKRMHRLCGQSGSGKTTQLCSALLKVYKKKKPVVVAVRTFSEFHPNYNSLLKEFGKNLIREKTNGFALKCLCATLKILVKKGVFFILDLTILDPIFERFIAELFYKDNYDISYHILSVPKNISDIFIEKRKLQKSGFEAGRITLKSSSEYFYKILPVGLDYLVHHYPDITTVLWNAFDKQPCFVGQIKFSLDIFNKNRKLTKTFLHSESELRNAKYNFYKSCLTII